MNNKIMRIAYITLLLTNGYSITFAQESSVDCDVIYDKIIADHPIDLNSCSIEVAHYTLDECKPPSQINAAHPTSHMLLAIDASGSMAGKVGNETKM